MRYFADSEVMKFPEYFGAVRTLATLARIAPFTSYTSILNMLGMKGNRIPESSDSTIKIFIELITDVAVPVTEEIAAMTGRTVGAEIKKVGFTINMSTKPNG